MYALSAMPPREVKVGDAATFAGTTRAPSVTTTRSVCCRSPGAAETGAAATATTT